MVFKSSDGESIADLLHAWTTEGDLHEPAHAPLGICTGQPVGLHNLVPFSSRLRGFVIRSVEVIGYEGFEEVGVEIFTGLLNYFHVCVEDMDDKHGWIQLLLDVIQSPGGAQHLAISPGNY